MRCSASRSAAVRWSRRTRPVGECGRSCTDPWAVTTANRAIYAVRAGRGFEDAASVLGPEFGRVLVGDGWFVWGIHVTGVAGRRGCPQAVRRTPRLRDLRPPLASAPQWPPYGPPTARRRVGPCGNRTARSSPTTRRLVAAKPLVGCYRMLDGRGPPQRFEASDTLTSPVAKARRYSYDLGRCIVTSSATVRRGPREAVTAPSLGCRTGGLAWAGVGVRSCATGPLDADPRRLHGPGRPHADDSAQCAPAQAPADLEAMGAVLDVHGPPRVHPGRGAGSGFTESDPTTSATTSERPRAASRGTRGS